MESQTTTIYLHGGIEIPRLNFVPDALDLGDRNIDEKIQRVICVKNPSGHLPLTFTFVQKPFIRCQPRRARLQPNQSIEVLVKIEVQFNCNNFMLRFIIRKYVCKYDYYFSFLM